MATYDCTIKDDSGSTRIEGTIILPAGLTASTLNLVVVSATPPTEGQVLTADSATAASWQDIPA